MQTPPVVTSIDIVNLSHALKDLCEVQDKTPECLNETLKFLTQYNLLRLNLLFDRQLSCMMSAPGCCCNKEEEKEPTPH